MSLGHFRLLSAQTEARAAARALVERPAPLLILEDYQGAQTRWYTLRVNEALLQRLSNGLGTALAVLGLTPKQGLTSPPWQGPAVRARIIDLTKAPPRRGTPPPGREPVTRGDLDSGGVRSWDPEGPVLRDEGHGRGNHEELLSDWREDGQGRAGGRVLEGAGGDPPPPAWPPGRAAFPALGLDVLGGDPPSPPSEDPGGTEALSAPVPEGLELYPDLRPSREAVAPGDRLSFTVTLAREAALWGAAHAVLEVPRPAGTDPIVVQALVAEAIGFARLPDQSWATSFLVRRDGAVTPTAWTFQAQVVAPPDGAGLGLAAGAGQAARLFQLRVTFRCGASSIGSIEVTLRDREAGTQPGGAAVSKDVMMVTGPGAAAAVLQLTSTTGNGYEVLLSDGLDAAPRRIAWSLRESWFEDYRVALAKVDTMDKITELGLRAWGDLPTPVQDWLCALPDGAPLVVFSDVPAFPFELLTLYAKAGQPMLGAERPVLRWISDRKSYLLKGGAAACICPDYESNDQLPFAQEERETLDQMLHFAAFVRKRVDLLQLLERDDVSLIHFTGHADGAPTASLLMDERVAPTAFGHGQLLKNAHPFLFLNGCAAANAAGAQPAYLGNFPASLLSFRAAGVLVSLIDVNSEAAGQAARSFYQTLVKERTTLGEALRRLRARALREKDPVVARSLLSYLLYADAALKLPQQPGAI